MASPVFNNNADQPITANGNFCAIQAPFPGIQQQGSGMNSSPMLEFVSYMFTTGGTTTGNVNFQELGADGVWRTLAFPATVALGAALTYSPAAPFVGPFHGIRLVVSSLAVSTITYAELKATTRIS
jgi:hypothetical protein